MNRRRHRFVRQVKVTTRGRRIVIRLAMVALMPVACVAWLAIGLGSARHLGEVLRTIGEQLEEYDW